LRGAKAAANFTETAFVNTLVKDAEDMYNCRVYHVEFEAGRGKSGNPLR
jgi:hypothetical protein